MNTTNKADPLSLQEPRSAPRCARDESGSAPFPNLSGWLLWLYVGLMLAALAAVMGPPIFRALRSLGGAL